MARARDPNRDKAFEIYKKHKGNIDLVEIAIKVKVDTTELDEAINKFKTLMNFMDRVVNKGCR